MGYPGNPTGGPNPQQPWQQGGEAPMTPPAHDQSAQPGYGQPILPPQPGHPQPTHPPAGADQPTYPMPSVEQPPYPAHPYGQPAQTYPPTGTVPPAMPYAQPGMPPPPSQRGSRVPLILGIVGGVLLLCVALGAGLYALGSAVSKKTAHVPTVSAGTPTIATKVVYHSALTATDDGWPNDSQCAFKADGYHTIGAVVCYAPPDAFNDGSVEVMIKEVSGPSDAFYGIVFRRVSKGNFYIAQISNVGQWNVEKVVAGTATGLTPFQGNAAIHRDTGSTNTLKVVYQGGHIEVFINGTLVGSVDDTTYSTGLVGVAGDTNTDVVFTNMTVSKIG
jgi:hypothetical protein